MKITKVQLPNQSKEKIIKANRAKTKNAFSKTRNEDNGEQTKDKKVGEKDGAQSV